MEATPYTHSNMHPICETSEVCTNRCENLLKITALIASLIILTVAIIAALVNTGVFNETFVFYSLHHMGQLSSSVFLTLSLLSTLVLTMILTKSCIHFDSKKNLLNKAVLKKFV